MYSVQHAACWPRPQIAAQGQAAGPRPPSRGGRPPAPRPRRTTLLMAYNPYMPAHDFQLLCPCDSVTPRSDRGQPSCEHPMRSLPPRTSGIAAPSGYGTTLCRLPQQREERNRHRITPTEGVERDAMAGFIVTQAGHEQTVVQLGALPKTQCRNGGQRPGAWGSAAAATPITAVRSADQLRQGRCSTLGSRSARVSSAPATPR